MGSRKFIKCLIVLGCMIAVFGCAQVPDTTPQSSSQTAVVEVTPTEASPTNTEYATLELPTATATSTLLPPRHLTICMGAEPDTVFIYFGSMLASRSVLEAIYDGPIDRINYEYLPVILEKIPSLADGDAEIRVVSVVPGQDVVDVKGDVVSLVKGVRVRPAGCRRNDCTITFDGSSPLEMDQMVVTFRILEDLMWEDGEPLTAEDSVFSFGYAQKCRDWNDEECGDQGLGLYGNEITARTAAYTALDALTNQWVGLPGFLNPDYQVSFYHPLPEHKYASILFNQSRDTEELELKPIGWGPYRIIEYTQGQEIQLEKNPYYFRADEGLPFFDTLTMRFIGSDGEKNLAALQEGTCDLLDLEAFSYQPLEQILQAEQSGGIKIYNPTRNVWELLTFNFADDHPNFFGDLRTRKGIAYCLDRPRIIDEVFFGFSEIPALYVPASHPLAPVEITSIPYDPESGEALLTEAGWIDHDQDPASPRIAEGVVGVRDGTPFRINYWTTNADVRKQVSEILAESLAECGIQVDLAYWTSADFFAESSDAPLSGKAFDLAEFARVSGPYCDFYLSSKIPGNPELLNPDGSAVYPAGWNGVNVGSYQNPAYDAACESALAALPGEPEYQAFHQQAMKIFAEDLPSIPLYQAYPYQMASRVDMCGVVFDRTARSNFPSIESFNFGEACHP